ncbi:TetR/AcrR family transcriptional regulator [Gordonia sp. CPCC 205333]|uniref:TetR/AcrR family transcriptional regulator n=1 Tax=Gordonia sp. CPCC 205333 TaxID=3140790 RepID=UPI003AF3BCBD
MPRPRTRDAELFQRFVDAATQIAIDEGVAALTTRRASEAAGSNIAALNQLFGSRDGLVDAVMAVGFDRLAERAHEHLDTQPPGAARLHAFAATFREFADDARGLVDVMLARPLSVNGGVDLAGAWECRRMLTAAVGQISGSIEDIDSAALGFAALVEGLATSERRGLLGGSSAADQVWRVAIEAYLAGLAAVDE